MFGFDFKSDYPFIVDEYKQSHFNQESGVDAETLKKMVDDYLEKTKGKIPNPIRRSESVAMILKNCQIEVNPHTPFADKLNVGVTYDVWCSDSFYGRDSRMRLYQTYDEECKEAWHERYVMDKIGLGAPDNDVWHTSPDWAYVIDNGIAGLANIAKEYLATATDENRIFYQSVVIFYDAVLAYMNRLENEALRVGNNVFAKCMHDLQVRAPENLYEAMETSLLYMTIEEIGIERCRTLGALDVVYEKLVNKALKEMTKEDLYGLCCYFLSKINAGRRYADQPICLGGYNKNMECPSGDFTLILLNAFKDLGISNPKIHVRYNPKMREDVFEMIIKCLNSGSTSFVLISDEVVMKGYEKIGIKADESWAYLPLGCYENAIPDVEDARICSCWINLYKPIEWAATGGIELSGDISLFEKEEMDNSTWDKFLANYFYFLDKVTERVKQSVIGQEKVGRYAYPAPFLSGALATCMKSGHDIFDHGMKYNNASMKYCCTGSAIDSLLTIKHFVYEDKVVTLEDFLQIIKDNFKGHEVLRAKILNAPNKHGSGSEEAGELLKTIHDHIAELILNKPNGWGGVYRVGTDSVENCDRFGSKCIASFDGRLAYTSFSKNMRPVNGMELEGLTGFMRNMLKVDQTNLIDGNPLDFILHPSSTQGEKGFHYFKEIIRYYLTHGGSTIMGNVLDINTLIDAQKHPENYQNLQIRVCGWNEYFVQMSKLVQDEFIERAKGAR